MNRVHRRPAIAFAAFWLIGVGLMVYAYLSNPLDPTLRGTARYGTTYAGELRMILSVTFGEVLASLAILRPWSYHHSWLRALITAVLLTPWLLLWGALGLHAGPTTHTHTTWLLLFWLGLMTSAAVSGFAAARARRTPITHAA